MRGPPVTSTGGPVRMAVGSDSGSAPTSTLILPGMSTSPPAIQGLVDHLEAVSASRSARRRCLDWAAAEPALSGYRCPAVLSDAIRTSRPGVQDELISALVRLAAHDDLAQLAAVAGLSRRLDWIVTSWRRAGVPAGELRTLESDLVSECWAAVAVLARAVGDDGGLPPRPALAIVQTAWEQVRGPRRRQRRHDARQTPGPVGVTALPPAAPAGEELQSAGEELAAVIVSSVRSGRLSVTGVGLVFATRVAGWTVAETAERVGCSPQSVRTRRARAEQRLTADLAAADGVTADRGLAAA